jgi:hypothetical protein
MAQLDTLFFAGGQASRYLDESGKFHVGFLCEAVGVGPAVFARLTKRQTESVAGLFSSGFVQPREPRTREVLKELLQIVGIFNAMGWSPQDVSRWMNAPLPTFGGQSPTELIEHGRGQELITRLVDLAAGNVGS